MSLRHIRYFLMINEHKSFMGAAKALKTTQSSLSKQIKDLEDYLGYQLFDRNKGTLSLTKAGNVFLEEAQKTLLAYDRLLNKAHSLRKQTCYVLKIGTLIGTEHQLPAFLLTAIKQEDPTLKVDIISGSDQELVDMLEKGVIEVALTRKNINTADITSYLYTKHELLFVTSNHYRINFTSVDPVERQRNIDFIIPSEQEAAEAHQCIVNILANDFINPKIVMETENAFTTLNYVSMGLGCAILPDYIRHIITEDVYLKKFNTNIYSIPLYLNVKNSINPHLASLLSEDLPAC